jgi:hypothetical protein
VLAYALLSPQISRYVDRYGESAFCLRRGQYLRFSHPDSRFSLGCGPLDPVSGRIPGRVYAQHVSHGTSALDSALSRRSPSANRLFLETVLDELTFIMGAPLSIGLSITLFPQAGLLLAVLCSSRGFYW